MELIPNNIKFETTLELFKKNIRKGKREPSPWRMCKPYLVTYRLYQLTKIASILTMVCTNVFYFAELKHCIG